MKKTCYRDPVADVSLLQTGRDRFTVVYGKSVKAQLPYAGAAMEFGAVLMHHLACEGKLDNRERGDK